MCLLRFVLCFCEECFKEILKWYFCYYFVENTVDNIKVYCQGNAFFKKENLIYIYGIQNLVYVMDNSLDILEGDIL